MGQLAFGDGEGGDMQASQPKIKVNVDASGDVIATAHNPDARFSRKRGTQWLGHKTQVTETVDGDFRIISDIDIRSAIESDGDALDAICERLTERNLLPDELYADQGYCHGETLPDSEKKGGWTCAARSAIRAGKSRVQKEDVQAGKDRKHDRGVNKKAWIAAKSLSRAGQSAVAGGLHGSSGKPEAPGEASRRGASLFWAEDCGGGQSMRRIFN